MPRSVTPTIAQPLVFRPRSQSDRWHAAEQAVRHDQEQRRAQQPDAEQEPRKVGQPARRKAEPREQREGDEPGAERRERFAIGRNAPPAPVHAAHFGDEVVNDDRDRPGQQIIGLRIADDPDGQAQAAGDAGGIGQPIERAEDRNLLMNASCGQSPWRPIAG